MREQVAYLVLASNVTDKLRLLIDTLLTDSRSEIYLHLDAKSHHGPASLNGGSRLHEIDRLVVNWGGFSIVRATIALLGRALADGNNQRFVLLSDACFPLRPMTAINDRLLAEPDPVVAVWGQIGYGDPRQFGKDVLFSHYPYDVPALNPRRGTARRLIWAVYLRINRRVGRLWPMPAMPIWKGSMFFTADRAFAEEVMQEHRALHARLARAHAPDELFFTTVYRQWLARNGRALQLTPEADQRQGHHFIRRRPLQRSLLKRVFEAYDDRRLELADVSTALASDALFARKCDLQVSRELERRAKPGAERHGTA